jgi:hypothetical protein
LSIKGKVLGSILGGIVSTNIWGFALGGLLGHLLLDSRSEVGVEDLPIDSDVAVEDFFNPMLTLVNLGVYILSQVKTLTSSDILTIRQKLVNYFNYELSETPVIDTLIAGKFHAPDEIDYLSALNAINRFYRYEEKTVVLRYMVTLAYSSDPIPDQAMTTLQLVREKLELFHKDYHSVMCECRPDRDDEYSLLGICENASVREIKSAYRSRIAMLHPDQSGSDTPEERALFQSVVEAYNTIKKRKNFK